MKKTIEFAGQNRLKPEQNSLCWDVHPADFGGSLVTQKLHSFHPGKSPI